MAQWMVEKDQNNYQTNYQAYTNYYFTPIKYSETSTSQYEFHSHSEATYVSITMIFI